MKKCAVVIGVNKTGRLPHLSAAVSGAKEFEKWARLQGIDVVLITDEMGEVTLSEIKKAVIQFVGKKTYTQMLVYFAGHGILKGPNDEHWLLSNSPEDPNEAVNVLTSKYLATNTGIPNIVFISDACRTATGNAMLNNVCGGSIFPNIEGGSQTEFDMFFATKPGDPAYESNDPVLSANNYKGIFTDCMLEALTGNVPEVVKLITLERPDIPVVLPYELKQYLDKKVPAVIQTISPLSNQEPRIEITSRPPIYLSRFNSGTNKFENKNFREFAQQENEDFMPQSSFVDNEDFDILSEVNKTNNNFARNKIYEDLNILKDANGISSVFNTGFCIYGQRYFSAEIDTGKFYFDDSRIYIENEKAKSILLILDDGTSIPVAILGGFIGLILIEENKVLNVNYVPGWDNNRRLEYDFYKDEVEERRAVIALAARNGIFKIGGGDQTIKNIAGYLRNGKAMDPSLGLYASYAFAQSGRSKEIESVFEYMSLEDEPVIYDVKMLASIKNIDIFKSKKSIAPFCPMLSQGWSYLPLSEFSKDKDLKLLGKHLTPGLWTTFNSKGTEIAKEFIKK